MTLLVRQRLWSVAISRFGGGLLLDEQSTTNRLPPRNAGLRRSLASLRAQIGTAAPDVAIPPLSDCISTQRATTSDQSVWEDTDSRQSLYVVESGIAFRFTYLANGKRHIDDVYGPGSICNWSRLRSEDYRCNLTFKSGARFALLDPARFSVTLEKAPTIRAALSRIETARTLRVSQRVRALISLPASHRIAILLLDLREEYWLSGIETDWVPLSLTQEEIADVTGMTVVHVNRTLAKMEQANELRRDRGSFFLPHPIRLEDQLGYQRFIGRKNSDGGW